MARQTLVLDASVAVKWFCAGGEACVPQARAMLAAYARGDLGIIVPDLFFHEISNALAHKKAITREMLDEAVSVLFDLGLSVAAVNREMLSMAVNVARKAGMTEYDACYAAVAIQNRCPLVTANPRHQAKAMGCKVIPLEEWKD
jgi:predicted nucleic acid-binding protein